MTPTISYVSPFNVIDEPRADGSALNLFLQKWSARMTTRAPPGRSSSGRNDRPMAGDTPRVENRFQVTASPTNCSGSPIFVRVIDPDAKPDKPSKVRLARR